MKHSILAKEFAINYESDGSVWEDHVVIKKNSTVLQSHFNVFCKDLKINKMI